MLILKDFTEFYFVVPSFTGFYWVLQGFIGYHADFTGLYWVLLGFTGFYWVLLGFTGFYWVFLGCTESYWFLLGNTGCCCHFELLLFSQHFKEESPKMCDPKWLRFARWWRGDCAKTKLPFQPRVPAPCGPFHNRRETGGRPRVATRTSFGGFWLVGEPPATNQRSSFTGFPASPLAFYRVLPSFLIASHKNIEPIKDQELSNNR